MCVRWSLEGGGRKRIVFDADSFLRKSGWGQYAPGKGREEWGEASGFVGAKKPSKRHPRGCDFFLPVVFDGGLVGAATGDASSYRGSDGGTQIWWRQITVWGTATVAPFLLHSSDLMRSSSGPDRSNDHDRSKSIPRRRPAIGCFKAVANSEVSYTKKGFCSDRLAISIRCSNH